jgi:uncharacterized protein (TIGR03066 family)
MRYVSIALGVCLVALLLACSAPTFTVSVPAVTITTDIPTTNKDKIVGTWEGTKPDAIKGKTWEFTMDGKLKVSDKGKTTDGTYSVDGDTLKTTIKGSDGKEATETAKITKLDDKVMATEATKAGKTETTEYKKK